MVYLFRLAGQTVHWLIVCGAEDNGTSCSWGVVYAGLQMCNIFYSLSLSAEQVYIQNPCVKNIITNNNSNTNPRLHTSHPN